MAMVVYPVMGTITPYAGSLDNVPGVVLGEAPSTAHALLGSGPQLLASDLPLPDPDESARAIAVNNPYTTSQHLPDCDPSVPWSGGNGQLTKASLCKLPSGIQLRADAAVAFAELDHRFKAKFGRNMCVLEGYRSLSKQYETKRRRGFLAATPGTSVHGWGLAFDLCGGDDRGATKQWLEDNGSAWGWVNPLWAKTRKFEPWHYEYLPGTDAMDHYGTSNWQSDGGGSSSASSSESDSTSTTEDEEPETAPEPGPAETEEEAEEPEPAAEPTP